MWADSARPWQRGMWVLKLGSMDCRSLLRHCSWGSGGQSARRSTRQRDYHGIYEISKKCCLDSCFYKLSAEKFQYSFLEDQSPSSRVTKRLPYLKPKIQFKVFLMETASVHYHFQSDEHTVKSRYPTHQILKQFRDRSKLRKRSISPQRSPKQWSNCTMNIHTHAQLHTSIHLQTNLFCGL